MRSLFINLFIDVEDGIRKHCHLSELPVVGRCPVQSGMVVVDEATKFRWEFRVLENWRFEKTHNVFIEMSETFDGDRCQYLYSNPRSDDDDSQDDDSQDDDSQDNDSRRDREVQYLSKEIASGRLCRAGHFTDHDFPQCIQDN